MMASMTMTELNPAAPLTAARAVADVARAVEVVESTMSCRSLEELFRPERVECVGVLDPADHSRVGLVTRDRCAAAMSGELGYGRALLFRRAVSELTDWTPTVVDPWTTVADALAIAMARPRRQRYDDLLVRSRVWGSVSVSVLVDALHGDGGTITVGGGMSHIDALTGLLARQAWLEALAEQCAQGPENGTYVLLTVVSVTGIAAVNATYGLDAGDAALAAGAEGLQRVVVARSTAGRLSGTGLALVARISAGEDASAVLEGDAVAQQVRAATGTAVRSAAAARGVPVGTLRTRVGYAVAPAGVRPEILLVHALARMES